MKVLVIGSGAREHALCRSLAADPSVDAVWAAPGNPGMEQVARCRPLPGGVTDAAAVTALAAEVGADLVVVGPEAPLVAGVADALRERGIACFGPSAAAARLEGSKAFAKEVMAAADVPTAMSRVCTRLSQVTDALDAFGAPHVVKDDGLAAGKGVVVTDQRTQALAHAAHCLDTHDPDDPDKRARGTAHEPEPEGVEHRVVVEEYLDGPELSVFCLTDGTTVVPLAPAQDFKRAGEGGTGPNTGGMGAYSPLDWAPADLLDEVVTRIAQPTIDEMRRRGTPFVGVLYVGLALTSRGPRVVEFNARFGDPDGQACLARLETPLGGLLLAAATGALAEHPPLRWREDHAVTVVLASRGYPENPRTGFPITGLDDLAGLGEDVYVLHAGTKRTADGTLVSSGGRVLDVVALGADLAQARERAYTALDTIHLEGAHCRRDIGLAAERGTVTVPSPSGA
ncbi:MAG TPA: phosphoribosylamine--glycine ligase [Segeticoccus sp.]|uniref:phosphoribosylamine--glycine ligase n=1 Tax=Segeticoccus sp. TaxID=2706531 RepID=UPI002D801A18|nr:phosphoribosylamine--glycine ligase [Segeticoccus sp.]HET8599253.1 phosphoribosylamine--glycine ligase [Segeticoccus sp.]